MSVKLINPKLNELKSDLSEYATLTKLDEYRTKDDFDVNTVIDLPIEHKVQTEAYDFNGETAFVEFHEGAQLDGYVIVWNDETEEYVHQDFSITFQSDYVYDDDGNHIYHITISEEVDGFCWNEKTNLFYASGEVGHAVHLNSAKLVTEDKLALKSDLDEYQLKSNTTITHYCPIEESMNKIDDFVVGAPVYLTGKVCKYVENKFVPSTESDTTDCICSVKTNGKWNEYV